MLRSKNPGTDRDVAVDPPARLPTGPPQTAEELYDGHGGALFSLACIILGDRAEAEGVVRHVLLEADGRPALDTSHGQRRRHLARLVYLRCTRTRLTSQVLAHDLPSSRHRREGRAQPPIMVMLGELSEQQRAAIALCLHGDHTYDDVADLMSLPAAVVADLLRSALHKLRAAESPG